MTQAHPPTYMTRFRLWWEALDAVIAGLGLPPLDYERARVLFDLEIEPEDVPAVLTPAEAAQ
jgi:hypothetical protein